MPELKTEWARASGDLERTVSGERTHAERAQRTRQKLAESQARMSANRNKNKCIGFLKQMCAEGRLSGFYGRLGDLGAIDDKYDVAVSTACSALDCLVVDTIDTAQRCVELLKANAVGSATFIALDKQEKWRDRVTGDRRPPPAPENAPRLIDLIKVRQEKHQIK